MDPFEDVLSIEDVSFFDMIRLMTRSNTVEVVMCSITLQMPQNDQ